MDLPKLKAAIQRANDCVERWFVLQDAAQRLLSNAGNILQRLPVLSDSRNFSALPQPAELQKRVLDKQTRALEAVFGRLQCNLAELEGLVRMLERLVGEVGRLLQGTGETAVATVESWATLAPGRGGATAAQMVECIEDVWRLCRDDLAVRAAALSTLNHTTSSPNFTELQVALQSYTGMSLSSFGVSCAVSPVLLLQSIAAVTR